MIVGRGRVKYILFEKDKYTIEEAKTILKKSLMNVSPVYLFGGQKLNVGRILKCPSEVDTFTSVEFENWIIFEYDKKTKYDNIELYENYTTDDGGSHFLIVNLLDELN